MKTQNSKLKTQNSKKPDLVRYSKTMAKVLSDQNWLKKAKNFPVYYVWRGVKKKGELRYDITVIPPGMLGKEFPKTKGNRNSKNFPEFYTVIEGEAFFLAQKIKEGKVKDVVAIKAKKGDCAVVSSEYILVIINPSKKILKMGNWVSEKNKNIYGEMEKFGGMSYFYTRDGWIKNKKYAKIPSLRFEKPLKLIPQNLDFLKTDARSSERR